MKLGISGPPGSGKDVAAQYLVNEYGFTHISTSDLLRIEADRLGLDHNRSTLQKLGSAMRAEHGRDILLDAALATTIGRTVFTGIRTIGAAQAVMRVGKLIYMDAPPTQRYERAIARGRNTEATMTFAEFLEMDSNEHTGNSSMDMSLDRVRSIAHYIINNDSSIDDLHAQLNYVVNNNIF